MKGFLRAYGNCSAASSGHEVTALRSASDGNLTQVDEAALTDDILDYSGYDLASADDDGCRLSDTTASLGLAD